MPDPIFDDPRLASVYDAFGGDREDLTPYVAIADRPGLEDVFVARLA